MKQSLFLIFLILGITNQTQAVKKPNILWIYLEDVSGWFSCYGDKIIQTPNIDNLAKNGIQFERFYTPAGVCSATRSSIITGAMQTSLGIHNHRSGRAVFRGKNLGPVFDDIRLPKGVKTLPEIFRKAGYWTFNEGGKDDYNFKHNTEEMYDIIPAKKGWGPSALIAGDCWKGRKKNQPFFGQVQLGGGKLGKRAKRIINRNIVPVPPYYPDIPEVREEIGHHYDCLIETDKQVGRIISALKRDDLYDNTLIFCFSDHGYKLHRHKQFLYEGGIQMPLIVTGKGVPSKKMRKDLVSGIDIAPTCLAAAGIEIPEHMEGVNFLGNSYTERKFVVSARDRCDYTIERIRALITPRFKYLRNYFPNRPFMQPSYKDSWPVSKRFREMMSKDEMNETQLIFFGPKKEPEELYDLLKDPHEINNLAKDPKFKKVLKQHQKLLDEWIKKTGDKGLKTESKPGLLAVLKRWGDKCVNPEYDLVRHLLEKN